MNTFQNFRSTLFDNSITSLHVLHIGAHQGQEISFYRESYTKHITLVEPIPELASSLRRNYPDIEVIQAAVGSVEGVLPFYVMEPTNVSTLQKPGPGDRVKKVIEVQVYTLQTVLNQLREPAPNVLVVDAQGKELDVLSSGDLSGFQMIITETCTTNDPNMASGYREVCDYMASQGFSESDHWSRDYTEVNRFARGPRAESVPEAEIRDVVFVRSES